MQEMLSRSLMNSDSEIKYEVKSKESHSPCSHAYVLNRIENKFRLKYLDI